MKGKFILEMKIIMCLKKINLNENLIMGIEKVQENIKRIKMRQRRKQKV